MNLVHFGVKLHKLRTYEDYQQSYQQLFPQYCGTKIQKPELQRKMSVFMTVNQIFG